MLEKIPKGLAVGLAVLFLLLTITMGVMYYSNELQLKESKQQVETLQKKVDKANAEAATEPITEKSTESEIDTAKADETVTKACNESITAFVKARYNIDGKKDTAENKYKDIEKCTVDKALESFKNNGDYSSELSLSKEESITGSVTDVYYKDTSTKTPKALALVKTVSKTSGSDALTYSTFIEYEFKQVDNKWLISQIIFPNYDA